MLSYEPREKELVDTHAFKVSHLRLQRRLPKVNNLKY